MSDEPRAGAALLLTGGPHPFAETTPIVEGLLADAGYSVTVVDSPTEAAAVLAADPPDIWVCNTLRWRMLADKYDEIRDEFRYEIPDESARQIDEWVRDGGRLLALHAAPICFDTWPGWGDLLGARWDWERSWHPPLGEMRVDFSGDHPLTAGLEPFTIVDEAYRDMWLAQDVVPLAVVAEDDTVHPMLWVRRVDEGTVVTCTLGHGVESFTHPTHRELLVRSIGLLGEPEPVVHAEVEVP